jgi:hypothetical protein
MTSVAACKVTPSDIDWFLESVPGATKEELLKWEQEGRIKIVKESPA